jgi:cytochrome c-type biogenesis protein CcmE
MTRRKQRRLTLLGLGMLALGGAAALVLTAFEDNIVFFYSPSDVQAKEIPADRYVRLGGLVKDGSVTKIGDGATTRFAVTDGNNAVTVRYRGLLPDLFREGQGVVTQGSFNENGVFVAKEVLAKHDENYMPPEVAEALKESGQWKHMQKTVKGGESAQ